MSLLAALARDRFKGRAELHRAIHETVEAMLRRRLPGQPAKREGPPANITRLTGRTPREPH